MKRKHNLSKMNIFLLSSAFNQSHNLRISMVSIKMSKILIKNVVKSQKIKLESRQNGIV